MFGWGFCCPPFLSSSSMGEGNMQLRDAYVSFQDQHAAADDDEATDRPTAVAGSSSETPSLAAELAPVGPAPVVEPATVLKQTAVVAPGVNTDMAEVPDCPNFLALNNMKPPEDDEDDEAPNVFAHQPIWLLTGAGSSADGAAVADHTDSDATMRPNLQNLFKQTLHWFESTMNKQIVRVKMLYQDARGKYLDLFVLPFEMPQAVPTDMPKTVDMKPRSGRNKKPKMEKDMKIMPKKEKVMKPMSKKGKFQEKSTRCRSRGAKHYKKVIHPRQRVTYKKPSALEKATEVSAWRR